MHPTILSLSCRPGTAIPRFRFNESSRDMRIKIPNSYSSASVDLHNSGSRNKPTIVSSRSAAVDDTLRRGEGCRLGGREEEGGGEGSRKSDRMSTTNLSAILREFFPWQRATSGENRALRLHSLINMQIWRRGARALGREGVRNDSRGRESEIGPLRGRERARVQARREGGRRSRLSFFSQK